MEVSDLDVALRLLTDSGQEVTIFTDGIGYFVHLSLDRYVRAAWQAHALSRRVFTAGRALSAADESLAYLISEQRHQCVEQDQVRFGDAVVRQAAFTRRARAILSGTPRRHPPP